MCGNRYVPRYCNRKYIFLTTSWYASIDCIEQVTTQVVTEISSGVYYQTRGISGNHSTFSLCQNLLNSVKVIRGKRNVLLALN